ECDAAGAENLGGRRRPAVARKTCTPVSCKSAHDPARVDFPDAVVRRIRNVDIAALVNRQLTRLVEPRDRGWSAVARKTFGFVPGKCPNNTGRVHTADICISRVADEYIALRISDRIYGDIEERVLGGAVVAAKSYGSAARESGNNAARCD